MQAIGPGHQGSLQRPPWPWLLLARGDIPGCARQLLQVAPPVWKKDTASEIRVRWQQGGDAGTNIAEALYKKKNALLNRAKAHKMPNYVPEDARLCSLGDDDLAR